MKLATLVYLRTGGKTLMLHRIKKANDIHEGKWNGLGGKLEPGETPEACAIREVLEESGLHIEAPELRGIITFPLFARGEDWYVFLFVARHFSGALIDSGEGRLAWIPDADLLSLPLWPGDRIFLPWLEDPRLFSACFRYEEGSLTDWSATFYAPGGAVSETRSGTGSDAGHSPASGPVSNTAHASTLDVPRADYRYTPREDTYCWLCGADVEKRHCKIICHTCGFVRDCSDP